MFLNVTSWLSKKLTSLKEWGWKSVPMPLLLYCMLCKLNSVRVNVAFISKQVSVVFVVSQKIKLWNGERMNSQTSTKQTKARPNRKTAESTETTVLWTVFWKSKHDIIFHHISRLFVSGSCENWSRLSCPCIMRITSSDELSTMSKINLRGITLGRTPIWGIHSLTLIFSCRSVKAITPLSPSYLLYRKLWNMDTIVDTLFTGRKFFILKVWLRWEQSRNREKSSGSLAVILLSVWSHILLTSFSVT